MKTKKRCTILRLVYSTNPIRAAKSTIKIIKPSAKVYFAIKS